MNYSIPQSWKELNDYQLQNVCTLIFSDLKKDEAFAAKLLMAICAPNKSWWQAIKFQWLYLNVTLPTLLSYIEFAREDPNVFNFPEIKGLSKPTSRLGSLTIKHFSVADYFFYHWKKTKNKIYPRLTVTSQPQNRATAT